MIVSTLARAKALDRDRRMAAGRMVAVASILNLLITPALATSAASDPWDEDRARPMFGNSASADAIGLAPVWSLVVRDSGRKVEVATNRFNDPAFRMRFPVPSIELRRFRAYGRTAEIPEMHLEARMAVVRILPNGQPASSVIRWAQPPASSASEPRGLAGSGPIPRDGSQYCRLRDGKFLLVLRLMPHAVNVRGETGHFGLLDYFDVSNPKRPRRIGGTLEADGPLHNGTVSDDGSRLAVQILTPNSQRKVVAFERSGRSLSAPRVVVPATTADGLQFERRFLFVGMQRQPMPVFVETSTTEMVSLYDLGD